MIWRQRKARADGTVLVFEVATSDGGTVDVEFDLAAIGVLVLKAEKNKSGKAVEGGGMITAKVRR